jgi:hypothetical protein
MNEREEYDEDDDYDEDDEDDDEDYDEEDEEETIWTTIEGDDDDEDEDDDADWLTISDEGEEREEEIDVSVNLLAHVEDVTRIIEEKGYTMLDLVSVLMSRPSRMDSDMDISYVAKTNVELHKIFDTLDKLSFIEHMERNGINIENVEFVV